MVVVASRLEAVRWQLAIDKYIKYQGYKFATLVAFSGEINDPQSGPDPFTETSKTLNPNLRGRDIREAFNTDEYQILLVANKFQTGFDQPLLCGMYVDKRLAGIQAVQTLSRLNRAHHGKDTTYVLDFVNDPRRNPDRVQDLLRDGRTGGRHRPESRLRPAREARCRRLLRRVRGQPRRRGGTEPECQAERSGGRAGTGRSRLLVRYKVAQERFRIATASRMTQRCGGSEERNRCTAAVQGRHGRIPAHLRVSLANLRLRQHGHRKALHLLQAPLAVLEFGREREGIDLSKVILTHHNLKRPGPARAARRRREPEARADHRIRRRLRAGKGKSPCSPRSLTKVNDLFEGELTDDDQLVYVNNVIKGKLLESVILAQQATNNTKEQFANSPDLSNELLNAIMDALAAHRP